MNKRGQSYLNMIGFMGSGFASLVIYFLALDPIINPTIELALESVTSAGLRILIKLIPLAVIFGFILFVVSNFTFSRR